MGFSRQYRGGLVFPTSGDLLNPGIEQEFPTLAGRFFINCTTCEGTYVMKVKVKSLSIVRLFVTPWTVAHQAPPSMGFSRQEYWSGLPFPSPGHLSDPGIEPRSPALQADALTSEPPGKPEGKESEVAQSCPTLCDPMDYSLPGSSLHGILQARVLEGVAISFSRGSYSKKNY